LLLQFIFLKTFIYFLANFLKKNNRGNFQYNYSFFEKWRKFATKKKSLLGLPGRVFLNKNCDIKNCVIFFPLKLSKLQNLFHKNLPFFLKFAKKVTAPCCDGSHSVFFFLISFCYIA